MLDPVLLRQLQPRLRQAIERRGAAAYRNA